ncbi:MAG: RNA polymerase-binding protein DksA [Pseudomonadota bacterium]
MAAKKPAAKAAKPKKPAPKKAPAKAAAPMRKAAAKPAAPKPKITSTKAVKPLPKSTVPAAAPASKPTAGATPAAKPAPAKPAAVKPAPARGGAASGSRGAHEPESAVAPPSATTQTQPRVPVVGSDARPVPPPRIAATPAEGEEEGAEAASSLSLLAGPRNVTPYRAKKGEQYMSKEQVEHFRTILNTWKRDLMEEVDRTVTHMKDEAANPPDPNDRATLESEFSLELRTRDRERKLIRKIDEALKRIEDGSYGYCLETGEEIGIKRLEARPVATLSIEAQERRERREKQYGDRDDRYR